MSDAIKIFESVIVTKMIVGEGEETHKLIPIIKYRV